ncbi:MAG TPA: hypothetical protein VES20_05155 [Bryobacteraceae bacterium]|nr:hypothetical protein [Bryobacteraceae bacterium]
METEFVLANSGGTTEYRFTQAFVNTRSAAWSGFRFELGFATGAAFVQAGDVSFDVVPLANSEVTEIIVVAIDPQKVSIWCRDGSHSCSPELHQP